MTTAWSPWPPSSARWHPGPRSNFSATRGKQTGAIGLLGSLWRQRRCGFGIWATHFIAMLAFTPGMPSGYNLRLTLLSLVYAVGLTGLGLAIGLWARLPFAAWIGGALVGGGVATMHYTGMAAFEVNGRIVWDPVLVVVSIGIGAALGGCSLSVALGGRGFRRQVGAATLLLLAICGHHFTAMGAVTIVPDPLIVVTPSAVPSAWLAIAVALASLAILLFRRGGRGHRHA